MYDHTAIESPGARFENVVALHILKLVDVWNDRGHGDFALHYVRDKEKREVDFLVTEGRRPFLLVEAKLGDGDPSPALRYFRERLRPAYSVQLVREGQAHARGAGVVVAPAARFLALC